MRSKQSFLVYLILIVGISFFAFKGLVIGKPSIPHTVNVNGIELPNDALKANLAIVPNKYEKIIKNIVLVLMNGRPLTINWAAANVPTIVEAWQLGTTSGDAIAQVLYGAYNPSGKLPMTFPRSVGQIPLYYNHYSTGRPAPIDLVFWSHYTDEKNTPLYAFGHGLSYAHYTYSNLTVNATNADSVVVQVTVRNTSKVQGEEVVQLYIQDVAASVVRPVQELKGFAKMDIAPAESKQVTFVLTAKELGFYNEQGILVVEPGKFNVMVGGSSNAVLKTSFELK